MGIAGVSGASLWGPPPIRETVSAAAYRRLREAILSGQIPMGARINEVELASAWRVSRTPVRDALRRLEIKGLVQPAPGRGVVVPRLQPRDVDELYEVREILEARAARRAAEQGSAELAGRLNTLIKAFGTALKDGHVERMLAVDAEFHETIGAASGNLKLQRLLATLRAQSEPVRLRGMRVRTRAQKTFREMAKLVAAMRSREGARAEAAMREHLASLRADLPGMMQGPEEEA